MRAAGLALVFVGLAGLAQAQDRRLCLPLPEWLDRLQAGYGERTTLVLQGADSVLVLTVNPATETWSLGQRSAATGLVCPRLSGQGVYQERKDGA